MLPRQLPPFGALLDDLGRPPSPTLARALGVSSRTVERWRSAGHAPRPVLLALFWLTQWGASALDAELHNRAAIYRALSDSRLAQVQALKRRIDALEAVADTGAANAPFFDPLDPDLGPRFTAVVRRPTGV